MRAFWLARGTLQATNKAALRCQFRPPGLCRHGYIGAVMIRTDFVRPLRAAGALALACWACVAAAQATPAPEAGWIERMRALVNGAVDGSVAGKPRVEVEVGALDPRLQLAPCRRVEPQLPPNARLWGRVRVGLRCVEGERPWQVWVPVQVKVMAPALVAARALPAGATLSADMFQPAEVDWAASADAPFTQAQRLDGRVLQRALGAGEAVRPGDLRQRQWFAAGDTVTVLARGAGFVVSGTGEAMGHGLEGRPVRVRTESGRMLTGTAVGAHRVEVPL